MKTFFTAALILTTFTSLKSQWYMSAEDGISIKKVNNDAEPDINAASTKSTTSYTMFFIGAKFGYQFNPVVIEVDGKLNLNMTGMIGIYSGVILPSNKESNFHITPLVGISPGHNFTAAARLQYKHFFLEANKTGNTAFYSVGVKCYIYE